MCVMRQLYIQPDIITFWLRDHARHQQILLYMEPKISLDRHSFSLLQSVSIKWWKQDRHIIHKARQVQHEMTDLKSNITSFMHSLRRMRMRCLSFWISSSESHSSCWLSGFGAITWFHFICSIAAINTSAMLKCAFSYQKTHYKFI